MKESYRHPDGHAVVWLKFLEDDDWEVQNVVTTPTDRGRGLQRELWKEIVADADREGACLLLTVGSGRGASGGGLTHRQLWDWYERLGFCGLAGTRMQRVPATCAEMEWPEPTPHATLSGPGGAGRPTEGAPR